MLNVSMKERELLPPERKRDKQLKIWVSQEELDLIHQKMAEFGAPYMGAFVRKMLKDQGVEVYFINDGIKTFDGDGELRLAIMPPLPRTKARKHPFALKAANKPLWTTAFITAMATSLATTDLNSYCLTKRK